MEIEKESISTCSFFTESCFYPALESCGIEITMMLTDPGKAPIQGEVLTKQEQIYRDLGVTPLLASPQVAET